MKQYNFSVFICRAQIFHKGHKSVIDKALSISEKAIILIGSAHQPRSLRNPFTFEERKEMILGAYDKTDQDRLIIIPLQDNPYNDDAWIGKVQSLVKGAVDAYYSKHDGKAKITLIGHSKDHSSYYLEKFPQWDAVNVENIGSISSTNLRDSYYQSNMLLKSTGVERGTITKNVIDFLMTFRETPDYSRLREEFRAIEDYKESWKGAPYPPTFVTTDAVVIQSGHILLVRRKVSPGKGLIALPGGFLGQSESLESSMVRELREETRIKVASPVIRGSIKSKEVFDDVHRSSRGRTVTHAFLVHLNPVGGLPKVRGGDDADKAFWMPLSDLRPEDFFEDHYFIIQKLLGGIDY